MTSAMHCTTQNLNVLTTRRDMDVNAVLDLNGININACVSINIQYFQISSGRQLKKSFIQRRELKKTTTKNRQGLSKVERLK